VASIALTETGINEFSRTSLRDEGSAPRCSVTSTSETTIAYVERAPRGSCSFLVGGFQGGTWALSKFHADSSLDTSFGPSGTGQVFTGTDSDERPWSIMSMIRAASCLMAGAVQNRITLARNLPDGTPHSSYGPGGNVPTGIALTGLYTGWDDHVSAVRQQDGKCWWRKALFTHSVGACRVVSTIR
jgi:hypothetical protein